MGPVTFNFAVLSSEDKSLQHTGRKKKVQMVAAGALFMVSLNFSLTVCLTKLSLSDPKTVYFV